MKKLTYVLWLALAAVLLALPAGAGAVVDAKAVAAATGIPRSRPHGGECGCRPVRSAEQGREPVEPALRRRPGEELGERLHRAPPEPLQRGRLPQHERATRSTPTSRPSFEAYFRNGGGFVGIGSAIETDPSWQFLTDILGTRSSAKPTASQSATIKVADRVHDATQEPARVLGPHRHLLQLHDERPRRLARARDGRRGSVRPAAARARRSTASTGGTMGADHPVSWCKDYQGGRSFYTALGNTADGFDDDDLRDAPQGRDRLGRRRQPTRSTATAARPCCANYQQVKISGAAEPERADRLRPASRTAASSRPTAAAACACTTRRPARRRSPTSPTRAAATSVYTQQRGRPVRPGGRQQLRHEQVGLPLLLAADRRRTSSCSDGTIVHADDADTTAGRRTARPDRRPQRLGSATSATSSCRASSSSTTPRATRRTSTWRASSRSCASRTTAALLPRRRRHRLRQAQQPVDGHRRRHAGRRRQRRRLRPVQRPADRRERRRSASTNATGGTFTLTFNGQTTAPLAFNATAAQIDAALEALSQHRRRQHPGHAAARSTRRTSTCSSGGHASSSTTVAAHRRRDRPDRHHPDGHDRVGTAPERRPACQRLRTGDDSAARR